MPDSCCVIGCTSRRDAKGKMQGLRFYRIPLDRQKRSQWVFAISRKNWHPNNGSRVCSRHFVSGCPSDSVSDVDYKPTVLMRGVRPVQMKGPNQSCRAERSNRRATSRHIEELVQIFQNAEQLQNQHECSSLEQSLTFHDYARQDLVGGMEQTLYDHPDVKSFRSVETQTDITLSCMTELEKKSKKLSPLQSKIQSNRWSVDKIKDNDKATKFYTGLPSFAVFLWLFNLLKPKAQRMSYWGESSAERKRPQRLSMSLIDQLLFVLMRLKVGLFLYDLADRFCVSTGLLSKVFTTWIHLLDKELALLNPCPTRQTIAETLPQQFQKFRNIRFIIDCTELFIERSSNFTAQNLTFSNYKHHTTVKFFVSITPTGQFNFVSKAWGGKVSDRFITEHCGFLDIVEKDDLVMADKGFNIGDMLARRQAFLNIPPFLYNKQFTEQEVLETERIAKVRIHVERAIGRAKQFHILDPVIPLSLKKIIEPTFRVCCFLSNIDKPLVS